MSYSKNNGPWNAVGDVPVWLASLMPSLKSSAPTDPAAPTATQSTGGGIMETLSSRPVRAAASAAMVYHGYARSRSVGWAVLWGLLGGIFPLETVPIALVQGFAKPKTT